MTTIRVTKRTRYAVVAQETVNDTTLSFRARGVLFWLLEKPDDWRCDSTTISRSGTEGREAVRAALRELEDAGYLRRTKTHGEGGHWKTVVEVYERPTSAQEPGAGQPGVGSPGVGFLGAKGPSTKTQPLDQSSSSSTGSHKSDPPTGAEEEGATQPKDEPDAVEAAARLHAERALEKRGRANIGNHRGWKDEARKRWLEDYGDEARCLLAEDSELTAEELLASIEGKPEGWGEGLGYVLNELVEYPDITDEQRATTLAEMAATRAAWSPNARSG